MADYYKILEIDRNATEREIKKAYKKMAVRWHPDKNLDNKQVAEKKFKEVTEAYQVLSDKEKRDIYDKYGKEGVNGSSHGNFSFNGNIDPNDIFNQMFGSGFFGHQSKPKSKNFSNPFYTSQSFSNQPSHKIEIVKNVECSLEELYFGANKMVHVESNKSGIRFSKQYQINVCPGWKDGVRLTYNEDQANIVIIIKEIKHPKFVRDGDNLLMDHTITLKQALEGFSINVNSIDKSPIILDVGSITGSGVTTIEKKGMPIRKEGKIIGYGNILIKHIITLKGLEYHQKQSILDILK